MKQILLILILGLFIYSCVYENEEDAYYGLNNQKNTLDSGLIAHFCFQNSLVDSSKNNIVGIFNGIPVYEDNSLFGSGNKAIRLNGTDNYFEIPVGIYDTIAISMFFKGDDALSTSQKPYLLDYGQSALALNLDAVSGGTYMVLNDEQLNNPAENWISSYDGWNYLYVEAILSNKQFKIVYSSNKKADLVINSNLPNPITINGGSVVIGRSLEVPSADSYFKGMIDDIRIYNRKLSDAELYQISKVLQ